MVKYDTILKVFDNYLTKHPITEKLRNIGKSGKWTTSTNQQGEKTYTITYKDGTELTFTEQKIKGKKYNTISHVKHGKFDEDFQLHNGENFFNENQMCKNWIPEDHEIFNEFTYYKMSNLGMVKNRYWRGTWDYEDVRAEFYEQVEEIGLFDEFKGRTGDEVLEYYNELEWEYPSILERTSLNGFGDFFTVRSQNRLHDDDSIDKRIITDKGYTSETIGANLEEVEYSIGIDSSDCWTIVTLYEDGNPANRGAYLGYAERRNEGHNVWEEVLRPIGNKSERLIIDEKNKIIVQRPYEP